MELRTQTAASGWMKQFNFYFFSLNPLKLLFMLLAIHNSFLSQRNKAYTIIFYVYIAYVSLHIL